MKRIGCLCLAICMTVVLHAQNDIPISYRGFVDVEGGIAYNLNTAQTVSTNNMQFYTSVSTTHGVQWSQCFVGLGVGYYHSYRDKENIYPVYGAFCYTWEKVQFKPFANVRLGIAYDPYWISKVQKYGAIGIGLEVYKNLQVGCRAVVFSRPSRYFTANAAMVLGYAF